VYESEAIRVERDGRVAIVTIDRPQVRNALDLAAARRLSAAVDEIDNDPDFQVAIITGAGGHAFSAGADLQARRRGEPRAVIEPFGFGGFVRKPRRKPWISAVNGYAVGGGLEIALSCEIVIAAKNATFALPEVLRGLIGGGDCLPFAVHALPPAVAAEFALTGRRMGAEEALRFGLVNAVGSDALALASEYAARLCEAAPLAEQATLNLLRVLRPSPPNGYYALADATQATLMASSDADEGALAFAEKRAPIWTGE
jgi:enoyl-CoA hydratase/carnithine racemase